MIKHKSFKHGWFYHYRVHEKKLENTCRDKFLPLSEYLYDMFENCPQSYFEKGPRSSGLRFDVETKLETHNNHEVSKLAKEAQGFDEYKTAHTKVQVFMLNYDKNSIGAEIPIWLMPEELGCYKELFNDKNPLTGHIDVLQIKNNKIWVWDYKPKAHLEKFATTQTYFYALMLSKRTGIPLDDFMCGYFDEKIAYTFEPSKTKLPMISLSTTS